MKTDPYANREDVPFINHRERFVVPPRLEPPIDEMVSNFVGKKIYLQDPRLLKLIVKWKRDKPQNSMEPDNFLEDPNKIRELKKVLNGNL